MAELQAKNIGVTIQGRNILNAINIDLKQGDFYCIVGKNGSGKTTLLKTLCSLIPDYDGIISIDKKNIAELTRKQISSYISVVFQDSDPEIHFNVFDIVLMGRIPYKKLWEKDNSQDFQAVEQSLRLTNTLHLKDRSFCTLSGGERQRVLIARALCQDTPFIFLDEPISNLDIKHQFEIMDLLKIINQKAKKTILIVLHDLTMALQYCKSTIALKDGKMMFCEKTDSVITPSNISLLFDVQAQITTDKHVIINH